MLMTLVRTALWLVAVIAAALAVVWLSGADGGVSVELNGRVFGPFQPLEFVFIVLALGLLIWLLIKGFGLAVALVRFASGDETALSRFWNRSRERRGFDALSSGLTSLAEGDSAVALMKARKAERLLERPELTRLLVAQSAEASGQADLAREYYKQLATDPSSAYVGVRGLLQQALKKGETEKALKLARHAFELKDTDPELLTTLFDLQCEAKDWEGARRTLASTLRAKRITKDVADRREAVLLIADAEASAAGGLEERAKDLARRAHKKSPALVGATVAVAKAAVAEGSQRKALKTLKEAWKREPHPDIAKTFAALVENESPAARRTRFEALTKLNPDHPESKMLSAELALAAEDFPGARAAMGDLATKDPSARALAIMAAVERGAGADDSVVRGWLAKAVSAPRGPHWTCSNCGARQTAWSPRCERCDAFDSLDWKTTEGDDEAAAAAMLPILMFRETTGLDEVDAAAEASDAGADGAPDRTKDAQPAA